jgi:hypothetical protein
MSGGIAMSSTDWNLLSAVSVQILARMRKRSRTTTARHERVGDDVSVLIQYQDIGDVSDPIAPFVNHRLNWRRIVVEEGIDAGASNAFGDVLAASPKLDRHVLVDAPGQEAGHDQDRDTEPSDQNQQRPGQQSVGSHVSHTFQSSNRLSGRDI